MPPRYIARLHHVRELSLFGRADFAYWKGRLQGEGLTPAELDGKARIWIIFSGSKYMGVSFAEVSFAILLAEQHEFAGQPAAFLLQAFGSFQPFVWCERAFFSIPSNRADSRISLTPPLALRIAQAGQVLLDARMEASREPSHSIADFWEGPVFLPRKHPGRIGETRLFFSRVEGQAQTYPFSPGKDVCSLRSAGGRDVFDALIQSWFTPDEWMVRADATHSKSRTYKREAFR